MPLDDILRAMQGQADSEIGGITQAANAEAAQLLAEAEAEGKAIRSRHRARAEPMLITEAASLQNKAKLGALRAIANAREQLLTDSFGHAEDCLAEIRRSKQYTAIFTALVQEAVEGLGEDLVARVDPHDAPLATTVFAQLGLRAEIQEVPIPLGGLEIGTRDGRVIIVNTLASRLDRARSILRGPVATILSGKSKSEQEWTTTTAIPTPA